MRGVSAQSLDTVLKRTTEVAQDSGADLTAIAGELFEILDAIDGSNRLVRLLSDPGRDAEIKTSVIRSLFEGRVSSAALDITLQAVTARWSEQHHLLEALETAGVCLLLITAERAGDLDTVESELFQFARIIQDTPEISEAFDATRDRVDEREALVRSLLGGRALPVTERIARQAVRFDTDIKVPARVDAFATYASERRRQRLGVVTSAIALNDEQRERLSRILAARYGTEITLNYEIDPEVIGGMQVTVGDDLYDATIAGRVRDAREKLTA